MITLRPYQIKAHDNAMHALATHGNTMIVAFMGLGKTEMGIAVARSYLQQQRGDVLWLAGRSELVSDPIRRIQASWRDVNACGVGIEMSQHKAPNDARFVTASVQTLWIVDEKPKQRLERLLREHYFSLVVFDECHHAPSERNQELLAYLKQHSDYDLLGLTATPTYTERDRHISHVFDNIAFRAGAEQAIQDGYLVRPTNMQVHLAFEQDVVEAQANSDRAVGDSYMPASVYQAMLAEDSVAPAYKVWNEQAFFEDGTRRPSMGIAPTIEIAERMHNYWLAQGHRSHLVHSHTPTKERAALYEMAQSGDFDMIWQVIAYTEGTNIPPISCILNYRSLESQVLYSQAIGRGLRPWVDKKQDCLILDCFPWVERSLAIPPDEEILTLPPKLTPKEDVEIEESKEPIGGIKQITVNINDGGYFLVAHDLLPTLSGFYKINNDSGIVISHLTSIDHGSGRTTEKAVGVIPSGDCIYAVGINRHYELNSRGYKKRTGSDITELATFNDLTDAMHYLEGLVEQFGDKLSKSDKQWHKHPATSKQLNMLKKVCGSVDKLTDGKAKTYPTLDTHNMTRGEASLEITYYLNLAALKENGYA